MTKNSARNLFFIGIFACLAAIIALSCQTKSTTPEDTNSEKLTEDAALLPGSEQAVTQAVEPAPVASAPAKEIKVFTKADKGEAILKAKGCTSCHKIKGAGNTIGPDLTGVTGRLDLETLQKRLKDPRSVNPDSIMPNYGFSDEEIDTIMAFLKTL
jgi:cytochrome c2